MAMEGDDDEDPDGREDAKFSSDNLIHFQCSLVSVQFCSNTEEDIRAPLPITAPPSPARWRMSDTYEVRTQHVCGVAGQKAPMVPSRCQTKSFLTTQKVPAIEDDDFLAPIPYTAPLRWRKSETETAGIQWVDGIGVGWCGLEVVGVRERMGVTGQGAGRGNGTRREGRGTVGAAIHAPECTGAVG